MLINKLKQNPYFVYARKCIIKEVNNKTAKSFLEANHLFGNRYAKVNLGLYFENELVSLLTFSKHKKYEWELIRFCNLTKHSIVGGFSKLWSYFKREYTPNTVFSYNDIDISSDYRKTVYFNNDFDFIGVTRPSYFYTDGITKFHRLRFSYKRLPKGAVDEYSYTNDLGLHICYTTGNNRFLWKKNKRI